jgi:hypothetical protein
MGAICMIFGHHRDQRRVWHDGENFRAPCKRCGKPMIKPALETWRPFDSDKDFPDSGAVRKGRPEKI